MSVSMYVCMCVCIYVCMYVCMYVCGEIGGTFTIIYLEEQDTSSFRSFICL